MRLKLLTVALLSLLFFAAAGVAYAAVTDISGHWAQEQVEKWVGQGLAGGYPDGAFRPDSQVTRAEFVALANRAFKFTKSVPASFTDVTPGDWFAGEVARARAAGYVSGYEDGSFRPGNSISRQEAAAMLARILKLEPAAGMDAVEGFVDAASIPGWSRGAINSVVAAGLMAGYPDGTFRPSRAITRAEAVVILDRALAAAVKTVSFDKAGIYGPAAGRETIAGNVTISAAGVTLKNTVISGNLLLAEGIGEGDVRLENVTVKGVTLIKGGGSRSVEFEDCEIGEMVAGKDGVRIVASGSTSVRFVRLESGATLVEVTTTGPGFETVAVSQEVAPGAEITLAGNFARVTVEAADVNLKVEGGTINDLSIAGSAAGTSIDIAAGCTVVNLTLDAAASVAGEGKIENAYINASGSTIEQQPANTSIAPGVDASVGTGTTAPAAGAGGGGGAAPSVSLGTIADISIFAGQEKVITVDTNAATVTATSSNTGVAAVTVAGKEITVTGVAGGTAEISVTGSRSGYRSKTVSFTVTVRAEKNISNILEATFEVVEAQQ